MTYIDTHDENVEKLLPHYCYILANARLRDAAIKMWDDWCAAKDADNARIVAKRTQKRGTV